MLVTPEKNHSVTFRRKKFTNKFCLLQGQGMHILNHSEKLEFFGVQKPYNSVPAVVLEFLNVAF